MKVSKRMAVILTAILSALLIVLILNFRAGEKKIEHRLEHLYAVESPDFLRSVNHLLGPRLMDGNVVTPLENGDQIFPAMLDAIKSAERTICFETYIYWSGAIGHEFSKALSERAKSGVKVHVIIDWVGSATMDKDDLKAMEAAGVELERFHPPKWYTLARLNNRTHRKLLIIDGKLGFTGGVGIADHWQGNAQDKDHWRDSHFKLEGPSVAQMQAAFLDNWLKTKAQLLHGPEYFPELEPRGSMLAQVFESAAHEGSESIRLMYLLSIASAAKSIHIASSYFVPDDLSVDTLVAAAKRGVTVEFIVPGEIMDMETVQSASRARWGRLLEAGAKIYEYQPTMYHKKVMIIDSIWTSVGSTNFDNRSFRLNAEANLNVYDKSFAANQIEAFIADRALSKEVTLEAWENRPWWEKVKNKAAELLRSQL